MRKNRTQSVNLAIALSFAACAAALAGCTPSYLIVSQLNYLTYDRPFTDATAASVRKDAEKRCKSREKVAIMASNTCSLTRCTTNYECVTSAEEKEYHL